MRQAGRRDRQRRGRPPDGPYDKQRRTYAVDFVQEQTIANKKRLEATDLKARAANLQNLRDTAADPDRARNFLLGSSMIAAIRRNAK